MDIYRLPNIRKIFAPDPGYMLFDADLKGADAQVVAAEAEDFDLLDAFAKGLDVHEKNAEDIMGDEFRKLSGYPRRKARTQNKIGVHLTNYGGKPRTMAITLKWTIARCEEFQRNWFALHPGIQEWHRRVDAQLHQNKTIHNEFGYRIQYFDRTSLLLPQALAWIPQSTVALVCFKGALQLEKHFPQAEILLQVHDNLVFQVPFRYADDIQRIQEGLTVPVPYSRPLTIGWSLKRSETSWGECAPLDISR